MELLYGIAAAVVFYLVLIFILHEMFRKFFRILLFIGAALFVIALLYFMVKGA